MIKLIAGREVISKTVIVFFIAFFLVIPGCVLAETPNTKAIGTPYNPVFVSKVEELIDGSVEHQTLPSRPGIPIKTDVNIVELLQQLNETLILGYLESLTSFGPRKTETQACDEAANYIYNTFKNDGLSVRYHSYVNNVVSGRNIEATLFGVDQTHIFIICGHYDTVLAGPGADDDGSGVAAVLAAAEIMSKYKFDHTIRFVAFSGEEQGEIGSRYYAGDAHDNNETIVAVLDADMIGFTATPSDGSKGKIFENSASKWIVEYTQSISQLYADYINIQLIPQEITVNSDHLSFWEYGYDAVLYQEFNFNRYYHSADDTIAQMNITYATHFSRLLLATLAEMAQQSIETPPVADAGPDQSVFVGATVQLDGSGSKDVDGDPLTFNWSFVNKPYGSTAVLSNPNIVNPTFIADKSGSYVVQLVVNNGIRNSAPGIVLISTLNQPPYQPNEPNPPKGVTGVSITTNLSWTSGDPDAGDFVLYDVYFGSMPPLEKVASNISAKSYNPGTLAYRLTYFWKIVAWDNHGLSADGPVWYFTTTNTTNNPPNKPNKPIGQKKGTLDVEYTYTSSTTDPDGDQVYYWWDWGDGNTSGWIGPYNSSVTINTTHTWTVKGSYSIKVKAKDFSGKESNWSDPLPITMPYSFNKPLEQFLELLFQRFPHAFPVLRHLLGC